MLTPKLNMVFIYTCNGRYSIKDIKRFLSHIRINKETGCWEWTGYLNEDGYGMFTVRKNNKPKSYLVHRMAIEISTNKLIPDGIYSCHHCDNPKCVNTLECLFLGTHQDNVDDMIKKGRQPNLKGEYCGHASITWTQVKEIRTDYSTGRYTQLQLGEKFNISRGTVNDIVKNRTWIDKDYIQTNFRERNTTLNKNIANKIRELRATGKYKLLQLAELFNTSISNISSIINNRRWA